MGRKGILLDPGTGDLIISVRRDADGLIAGGLVVGEADYQSQALILEAGKGAFKEHPALGADIDNMVNDHDLTGWKREITLQLEADGFKVQEIDLTDKENPVIDAVHS